MYSVHEVHAYIYTHLHTLGHFSGVHDAHMTISIIHTHLQFSNTKLMYGEMICLKACPTMGDIIMHMQVYEIAAYIFCQFTQHYWL